MWEAIRSNKRRSIVLIGLMGAILVILGFAIGMYIDPEYGGVTGCLGALVLWFILYMIALFQGDQILLLSANARQIKKEDAPQLWNVVEEMTIASGLGTMPKVYIIDSDVPNAFAAGRKPESAIVAVTAGLLKQLNRDELQGVIAHEIGHIKNLDIRFMTLASVLMGSIIIISDIFIRSFFYGGGRRRSRSSKDSGQAQAIFLAVAILLAILAPILAQLLYFACSRSREYLADASGARFTRYPEGLASALETISGRAKKMQQAFANASGGAQKANKASRALAPLYIINPLQPAFVQGLFLTHPPTKKRVEILRAMSGAGFADYEAAYKKVHGKSSGCIGARTLSIEEKVSIREAASKKDRKEETIGRLREVNDLLTGFGEFLLIPCACGLRMKIPLDFKGAQITCPRCGNNHLIPPAGQKHN